MTSRPVRLVRLSQAYVDASLHAVSVRLEAPGGRSYVVEQLHGRGAWRVQTTPRGEAHLDLLVSLGPHPFDVLFVREIPQVAIGVKQDLRSIDDALGGRVRPGDIVYVAESASVERLLTLNRVHLVVRAGVELEFGHDAGLVCTGAGGSTSFLGGAGEDRILLVGRRRGPWRGVLVDGQRGLPMRAFHTHIVGGAGTVWGEANFARGGNLALYGAHAALVDVELSKGLANVGGGLYAELSSVDLTRCVLSKNRSMVQGGGLGLLGASATLRGCRIEHNESAIAGGGAWAFGSHVQAVDTVWTGNRALRRGARIFAVRSRLDVGPLADGSDVYEAPEAEAGPAPSRGPVAEPPTRHDLVPDYQAVTGTIDRAAPGDRHVDVEVDYEGPVVEIRHGAQVRSVGSGPASVRLECDSKGAFEPVLWVVGPHGEAAEVLVPHVPRLLEPRHAAPSQPPSPPAAATRSGTPAEMSREADVSVRDAAPRADGTPPPAKGAPALRPRRWRRLTIGRRMRGAVRTAGALGTLASIGLVFVYLGLWTYGDTFLVDKVLAEHKHRTAVELWVRAAPGWQLVGFVHGPMFDGVSEDYERSIVVPAREVAPGGHLYVWWEATKALEDQWHDRWALGINPVSQPRALVQGGMKMVWRSLGGASTGRIAGGSTLSDQVCGKLLQGTEDYDRRGRFTRKAHKTACGIALRWRFRDEPHVIGAMYATHVPFSTLPARGVEYFVRAVYELDEGIRDRDLTRGHQLVLAAMSHYLWEKFSFEKAVVPRAELALSRLLASGVVSEVEAEEIRDEIRAARPPPLPFGTYPPSIMPDPWMHAAIYAARHELRELFGPETCGHGEVCNAAWRDQVEAVRLTIDPVLQKVMAESCPTYLRRVPRHAQVGHDVMCGGLMLGEGGEVLALHVGNDERVSERAFFDEDLHKPGSLGKLFLASALRAPWWERPTETGEETHRSFEQNLRASLRRIAVDAGDLDVAPERVYDLIQCFGEPLDDSTSKGAISQVTLGNWRTNGAAYLPYLLAASTDQVMPRPRVLAGYKRHGEDWMEPDLPEPVARHPRLSARQCAELAYNQGRAAAWLTVPREEPDGTLVGLQPYIYGGKTGTARPARGRRDLHHGTHATHVGLVVARRPVWVGGLFTIITAKPSIDMGDDASGSNTAGPWAAEVLREYWRQRPGLRQRR